MFGQDFGELANLSTPDDDEAGKYPVVLCEDCGPIQVNSKGECVSPDCYNKGHNV